MTAQGIDFNVSRRNDDLPEFFDEYSEKFNLSKAVTIIEILHAYLKLTKYKHRGMGKVRLSLSNVVSLEEVAESMDKIKPATEISTGQR